MAWIFWCWRLSHNQNSIDMQTNLYSEICLCLEPGCWWVLLILGSSNACIIIKVPQLHSHKEFLTTYLASRHFSWKNCRNKGYSP